MCGGAVRAWCEAAAAIFALLAAIAWIIAARHPVGVPGPSAYMPADSNHPLYREIREHGDRIVRGARWNQLAALLTGLSSLAAFMAWLLPRLHCIW